MHSFFVSNLTLQTFGPLKNDSKGVEKRKTPALLKIGDHRPYRTGIFENFLKTGSKW